jgi:hypothetical protein
VAGQVQGKNGQEPKKKGGDCDEPHLAPNEKMHPIQWTERPTGALVAAGSLCPVKTSVGWFFTFMKKL